MAATKPNGDIDTDALMHSQREKYATELSELDTRRTELATKLARIDAYFGVTTKPKATRTNSGPRAPRGSVQQSLLELIQQNPDGFTRAQILEKLEAKGTKTAEQSISNGLSALKKQSKLSSKDGLYKAA